MGLPTTTATPEAILDAALVVFARDGVSGARLEDVATAAGVTRTTLYYHFRSRDALVGALVSRAVDRLTARVADVAETGSVRDLALAILRTYADDRVLYRLLLTEIWAPVPGGDAVERIEREVLVPVTRRLARAIADGDVRHVDPRVAALALFGQVSAVALGGVVQDGTEDLSLIEAELIELVEAGLATGG
jgi:AcrR family transcriptional regulator